MKKIQNVSFKWKLLPYNSRADVVRLIAESYDTKSNVKLCGFPS